MGPGKTAAHFAEFSTARIIARHRGTGYGKMRAMAKKKRPKRFTAVEAVKTMARAHIGAPPASRIVPNRKKRTEKHKPTLEKLLSEPQ
jgi:hypothetical protein